MNATILTPEEDKVFTRFIKMGEKLPTADLLTELDMTLAEYLEMWENETEYSDDEYKAELEHQKNIEEGRSMLNTWLKSQQ